MIDSTNCTIMLPVANNKQLANECINHLLNNCDYNIIVVDDFGKDDDYPQSPRLSFIHNTFTERQGLVRIWNQCIKACPTDNLIMASWRVRPEKKHFDLIKEKAKAGFGLVAPATLHFFYINKHLTTLVGLFDEGFTFGQYEDTDFFNRMYMNDIAMYVSEEIRQVQYNSMWLGEEALQNKQYYMSKWTEDVPKLTQHKEEVNISDRELYKDLTTIEYKKFKDSELIDDSINNYYKIFTDKVSIHESRSL